MVNRDGMLRLFAERAAGEARRRGLDSYYAEALIEEARAIVDDFFASLRWRVVEDALVPQDSLQAWTHRTVADRESDWRRMVLFRGELQDAAERYLDRAWLHSREMDWLVVDVLVYAEYQATLEDLRCKMWPLSRYLAAHAGTTSAAAWALSWRALVTGVKWLVWAALVVAASVVAAPTGPIALVAVTAWWLFHRWRTRRRLNALLAIMSRTYAHLSTVSQGWHAFWQELNSSRAQGAVWDGVVYRLVEDRMRASTTLP